MKRLPEHKTNGNSVKQKPVIKMILTAYTQITWFRAEKLDCFLPKTDCIFHNYSFYRLISFLNLAFLDWSYVILFNTRIPIKLRLTKTIVRIRRTDKPYSVFDCCQTVPER